MKKWKIGILGCGNIADIYVINIQTYFSNLEIISCAALHLKHAQRLAKKYGIAKAYTKEEMLLDPEVEVVVNLTVPSAHYMLNKEILLAGKHVYSEKPLATSCSEIEDLIEISKMQDKKIGCAPDTWLGEAIQTCKALIEQGEIGKIVSVTANLMNHGVESWHPSPEAYYKKCGGPILDMGPYYITALVGMLGPVKRVHAFSNRGLCERVVYSEPLKGAHIPVEVDTSYCGILQFESGAIGNFNMSFDVWQSDLPMLEIHGTKGILKVPDPNFFKGEITLIREIVILEEVEHMTNGERINKLNTLSSWYPKEKVKSVFQLPTNDLRGLGIWDMMLCYERGELHSNHPELVLHVMEVLTKLGKGEENEEPMIQTKIEKQRSIVEQLLSEEGKSIHLVR